jgi:hypothetical protein
MDVQAQDKTAQSHTGQYSSTCGRVVKTV